MSDVSIVIPCHNYGRFLAGAVASAKAQTLAPCEVLVVDDGSTDDTASVALAAGAKLIQREQGGPSLARNEGASAATGELIVFLDADDELEPTFLERTVPAFDSADTAFVYTQVRFFGARDAVSSYPDYDLERLKRDNYIHASALLRRAAVLACPYDPAFALGYEDWDLYLGLAQSGLGGVLVNEPLLRYRQHAESRSTRLAADQPGRLDLQLRLLTKHKELYGPLDYGRRRFQLMRRRARRR